MTKITPQTERSEILEADFSKDLKAYSAAPTEARKREIARASSEEELAAVVPKRTVLKVSQKDVFDAMTPAERNEVFKRKSNRLYDFLVTDLKMTTLTLE